MSAVKTVVNILTIKWSAMGEGATAGGLASQPTMA